MTALIIITALTIGISALCSLFEAVLYSTRRTAVEAAMQSNRSRSRRTAGIMEGMQKDIASPLATILIVNTLANTAGATIAGTRAEQVLQPQWIIAFSFGLTLCILIFSEIIPKTLGALHWRGLWPAITMPLRTMQLICKPITTLVRLLTDRLSRGDDSGAAVTAEEILGSLKLGVEAGELERWESDIVHNLIGLEGKALSDIMTPRTVLFMLSQDLMVGQAFEEATQQKFTRIPVFRESRDDVIGYITLHDIALAVAQKRSDEPVLDLLRTINFTPETASCSDTFIRFLRNRELITIATDEFGGVAGIVSLEDLVETATGREIVDEHDQAVDLQQVAKDRHDQAMESAQAGD